MSAFVYSIRGIITYKTQCGSPQFVGRNSHFDISLRHNVDTTDFMDERGFTNVRVRLFYPWYHHL